MLKFSGYPYLIRGQPIKIGLDQRRRALKRYRIPIRSGTKTDAATAFEARPRGTRPNTQAALEGCNDARTGMPSGIPEGAMCVQRFDDSRNSAIHITYRISLRSSSMPEPRDPLLKVLMIDIQLRHPVSQKFSVSLAGAIQRNSGSQRRARQSNMWCSSHGWGFTYAGGAGSTL